jgi:hypothetical protein
MTKKGNLAFSTAGWMILKSAYLSTDGRRQDRYEGALRLFNRSGETSDSS